MKPSERNTDPSEPRATVPEVRRRPWFLSLARAYVRRRMRVSFDGVYLSGADPIRALAAEGPIVIAANHVAWWDPLFAVRLDEALGTESYALMDRKNLARLPFFGWVGAVPLDRENARASIGELRAAATLLDAPRKALWIFPQGTQRPAHLRPLGVKRGVAVLAEAANVPVVPLALNYLFRDIEKPAAFASFGEPILDKGRALAPALEASLERGLAKIDTFATTGAGDFVELAAPARRGDAPPLAKLLGAEPLQAHRERSTHMPEPSPHERSHQS